MNETTEKQTETATNSASSGAADKPDRNVRSLLEKNFDAAEAKVKSAKESGEKSAVSKKVDESKTGDNTGADRGRDNSGRFVKKQENSTQQTQDAGNKKDEDASGEAGKQKDAADKTAQSADTSQAATQQLPSAIQFWREDAKAAWKDIPKAAQDEILRRETEMHKKFTQQDEERNFGKQLKEIASPYMAMIQAEGSNVPTAVQSLLNTAYQLRNATAKQKGILLWQLASQFGADMKVDPKEVTQRVDVRPGGANGQFNPAALPKMINQEIQKAEAQRNIDAFAADPKNVYFEQVRPMMSALFKSGQAKDLQDAYDKACWSVPEIRSALLAEQAKADKAKTDEAEAKRLADIQAKTKAAKKASASVTGAPGLNGSADLKKKGKSVRELLEANYDAATTH